jgi:hypothetical protein
MMVLEQCNGDVEKREEKKKKTKWDLQPAAGTCSRICCWLRLHGMAPTEEKDAETRGTINWMDSCISK